jgi:prevent-host-death family protein
MRKTSLAAAKAHLSELVDEAEHEGKRTLILRRGKPSAAIVPVRDAVEPTRKNRLVLSKAQIERLFAAFGTTRGARSAVSELIRSRR